jgi:hypothetical protein
MNIKKMFTFGKINFLYVRINVISRKNRAHTQTHAHAQKTQNFGSVKVMVVNYRPINVTRIERGKIVAYRGRGNICREIW